MLKYAMPSATKYHDLYNSVTFDAHEMIILLNDNENGVTHTWRNGGCKGCDTISVHDVYKSLQCVKPYKNYGAEDLTSDVFVNSCHELEIHMRFLYTMMLWYGYCPTHMLIALLVPIPKDRKKSINNCDNYRATTLGSNFGEVLENMFLLNDQAALQASDF